MGKYEYDLSKHNKTRIFASDTAETLPELLKRIRKWAKQFEDDDLFMNFSSLRIDSDGEGNLTAEVNYLSFED